MKFEKKALSWVAHALGTGQGQRLAINLAAPPLSLEKLRPAASDHGIEND